MAPSTTGIMASLPLRKAGVGLGRQRHHPGARRRARRRRPRQPAGVAGSPPPCRPRWPPCRRRPRRPSGRRWAVPSASPPRCRPDVGGAAGRRGQGRLRRRPGRQPGGRRRRHHGRGRDGAALLPRPDRAPRRPGPRPAAAPQARPEARRRRRAFPPMPRPRSREAEAAILDATIALLGEVGFSGLTIDGIAARAGVGKATIYRHWSSKAEVAVEAFRAFVPPLDDPDTGSFADDVRAVVLPDRRRAQQLAAGRHPAVPGGSGGARPRARAPLQGVRLDPPCRAAGRVRPGRPPG